MTMQETPTDLLEEQVETEEITPDLTQERLDRIESQARSDSQKVQNQLGYLGRQLEGLSSQPKTVERDERIDRLTDMVEELSLRDLDPETQNEQLRKRNAELEARVRKPVEPKPEEREEKTESQEEDDPIAQDYRKRIIPNWLDASAEIGISWDYIWPKIKDKVLSQEFVRGDSTTGDPFGFRPLDSEVRSYMREQKKLLTSQSKSRETISTESTAGGAPSKQAIVNKVADPNYAATTAELVAALEAQAEGYFPKLKRS